MYSLIVGEAVAEQVMLNVTVAEINRTQMEQHGVDIRNFGGQFNFLTNYGDVAPVSGQHPSSPGQPPFPVNLTGLSWAIVDSKNDIAAIFKQLQDENLGKILAEPKLLARSGKKANFLSGGEIPIVVTTNDDTSIEFKEFGTKVDFVPRVREDGNIDLALQSKCRADFRRRRAVRLHGSASSPDDATDVRCRAVKASSSPASSGTKQGSVRCLPRRRAVRRSTSSGPHCSRTTF
jgi:Flp pilus assembly secretin CpaC